jgi:hypothetical protein
MSPRRNSTPTTEGAEFGPRCTFGQRQHLHRDLGRQISNLSIIGVISVPDLAPKNNLNPEFYGYRGPYMGYTPEESKTFIPLAPLSDDDGGQYWAQWQEKWLITPDDTDSMVWALTSASWKVSFGLASQEKFEILRAEWHNPDQYKRPAGDNDDDQHPQPHWHIANRPRGHHFGAADMDEGSAALARAMDVHNMHFGMGGWLNSEPPEHWQCRLSTPDEFVSWAVCALRTIQQQLKAC